MTITEKLMCLVTLVLCIWCSLLLYLTIPSAHAQVLCPIDDSASRRADGLVSAQDITSTNFSNPFGSCIDGNTAYIPTYISGIDSYQSFFTKYFEQSLCPPGTCDKQVSTFNPDLINPVVMGSASLPAIDLNNKQQLLLLTKSNVASGTLNVILDNVTNPAFTVTGSTAGVAVVFIDGNLAITSDFLYGKDQAAQGVVFIVSGQINIDSSVTEVNAVLISNDIICTACDSNGNGNSLYYDGATPGFVPDEVLNIYGSVISINNDPNKAINFHRSLVNNSTTAVEVFHAQPKYLVILKELMSNKVKIWQELNF